MDGRKRALISLLSVATFVLVSSCGVEGSNASVKATEPITVLDEFELHGGYEFKVFCRKGDKYIVSDVYHGWDVEFIEDSKDCEGK